MQWTSRTRPWTLAGVLPALLLLACSTTLTGRSQVTLLPDATLSEMGIAAFQEMKQEKSLSRNPADEAYVRCIVDALLPVIPAQGVSNPGSWDVAVFEDPTPNAFALPGGRIGVHTGMLKLARTQEQLAAVLGHEIGHVLLRHGNERASQSILADAALSAGSIALGDMPPAQRGAVMASLGLGAQVGVLLPFSRAHESEADQVGQDLMARAGFDPRGAIALWQNMAQLGGQQPPEFASTHPGHDTRISRLQENLPEALREYEAARAAGRRPTCTSPR